MSVPLDVLPASSEPVAPSGPDYDAAVARLFERRPECIVRGLGRIRSLCRGLGDPQDAYDTVHITGTNGKTSTARMVTSLLVEHGWRVGTATSPHLQDVRERVRIDGVPVEASRFAWASMHVEQQVARSERELGETITFFEALTCLGAICFRDAAVDLGVIEAGVGGRLDPTNVHHGRVAVIGTVALDHPELGSTVAEVAHEKAGIIEDDAEVVVGAQPPEAERVIVAEARARGARLRRAGRAFGVVSRRSRPGGQDLVLHVGGQVFELYLPLQGAHQANNAVCALAAVDALLDQPGGLCPDVVASAFARVRSPGRLEVFERRGRAPIVLDGAHNPQGARSLTDALLEAFPGRRVVAVLGVGGDKDVAGVVTTVLERAEHAVVTTLPFGRAAPVGELAAIVRRRGRGVSTASTPAQAIRAASRLAGPDGVVVVTGSLYLVGAVRASLGASVS